MKRNKKMSNLKKLQALWYKKLEKSGFKDIEDFDMPGKPLHHWDGMEIQSKHTPEQFQEKQRYYELAGQLYYSHGFDSERDKRVWCLHSEGLSSKAIARMCRMKYYRVQQIVKKYSAFIKKV